MMKAVAICPTSDIAVSIVMQCAVVLMAAAVLITMITVYSDGEQTPPVAESAPESQTSTVDNQTYSTANEAGSQKNGRGEMRRLP